MARRLKVFRTPIGFHDAYVAAPSRKAALEAWGSDADLFARGVAEEVVDAKLTQEPLARPGEVIRVSRGSTAEHLAALPKTSKRKVPKTADLDEKKTRARRPVRAKKAPRPKRDHLDDAESSLASAERRFDDERRTLERREAALRMESDELEHRRSQEIAHFEEKREKAAADYRRALDEWEP